MSNVPAERRGHLREATPLYLQIIDQLQDRIAFLGLAMWQCDDLAGLQDGYTAKLLHPDTPSGRQATWATLQYLIDALYPDGFEFVVVPRSPKRRGPGGRRLRLPLDKVPPHPDSVRTRRRGAGEKPPRLRVNKAPKPTNVLPFKRQGLPLIGPYEMAVAL